MSKGSSSRKSSFIWNFYDADTDEKARCRICKRHFSRKGCCTSGLITHLKKRHTETFLLYLNKGLVCLEGDEISAIKKESTENEEKQKPNNKRKKSIENEELEESEINFQSSACHPPYEESAEFPESSEHIGKPIEQMCLLEDEYPIVNIERNSGRDDPSQPKLSSQAGTTQIESLLTKQLQIQAKLYKEMKEKLEQISAHLKESERINRKRFRLKVEKLRLHKEELKKKELHRKEMHRLRLLELDILNKKNIEQQLRFDQL